LGNKSDVKADKSLYGTGFRDQESPLIFHCHWKLRESMTAEELIHHIPELPPAPLAACKLLQILQRPTKKGGSEEMFKEVTETIEYDPSLTAKLLKRANSSYMAGRESVFSVDQVVLRLGYHEIMQLAMAISIGDQMVNKGAVGDENPHALWEHSVTTAVAAEYLAETLRTTKTPSSVAFTAGILHDFGKIAFRHLPSYHADALKKNGATAVDDSVDLEKTVLGTNHAEVGAYLLEQWQLPQAIVQTVLLHHHPEPGFRPTLTETVYVADQCAWMKDSMDGEDALIRKLDPAIVKIMKLQPKDVRAIVDHIGSEAKRIKVFMATD
jgi:putative nucleotidyltransferase with HDIG domain